MKVGFIGIGNMGGAIAQAVEKKGTEIVLSDFSLAGAKALACKLPQAKLANNETIATTCQVIFLGVKPHQVSSLLLDLQEAIAENPTALWVSMAAGLSLETLSQYIPETAGLIRMMPNTPVAVGQGMTTYTVRCGERSADDKVLFTQLMVESGHLQELPEALIDAATGIAGCGPAFVYQFIDALALAGVAQGLTYDTAVHLAAQTVLGSVQILLETGQHPSLLRDQVTSPGGSTIAGLLALEKEGFTHATVQAVTQAVNRTKELGAK